MSYKVKLAKTGKLMYYTDESGKFLLISKSKIPPEELAHLHKDEPAVQRAAAPEISKEHCIFCEEPNNKQRLVNGQFIPLCDNHYYGYNLGKLTEKLRQLQEA